MSPRAGIAPVFVRAALRLLALFAIVFYGADALTAAHGWRVRLHLGAELAIPYWPAAFPIYFSVFAVPFLPLWLAPDADALRRWEADMARAIVIAGLCFVLLPGDVAYAPEPAGSWSGWAGLAACIAGRHNLLPSLHVALALTTLLHVGPAARHALRGVLALWFVLLVASVLLTHQHHVADVVAGIALALVLHARAACARRARS